MPLTPLEKLAFIIVKAREFDAQEAAADEASGSNPTDDGQTDVLEDVPGNSVRQELIDAVAGLSEPQRIELLALVFLGRGDYAKEEWHEAVREAAQVHEKGEAEAVASMPLLAFYLEEGLAQLGYSIEEYEIGRL